MNAACPRVPFPSALDCWARLRSRFPISGPRPRRVGHDATAARRAEVPLRYPVSALRADAALVGSGADVVADAPGAHSGLHATLIPVHSQGTSRLPPRRAFLTRSRASWPGSGPSLAARRGVVLGCARGSSELRMGITPSSRNRRSGRRSTCYCSVSPSATLLRARPPVAHPSETPLSLASPPA